jgi:hypothetical protein
MPTDTVYQRMLQNERLSPLGSMQVSTSLGSGEELFQFNLRIILRGLVVPKIVSHSSSIQFQFKIGCYQESYLTVSIN